MQASADAIDNAASEWVARIDRGLDRREEIALEQWLIQDERCRRALTLAQTVWANLDRAQVFRIAAEQSRAPSTVESLPPVYRERGWKPWAYVAGLVLFASGAVGTWLSYVRTHVSTAVGEIRQVPLDDGSRVTLDTGSRMSVEYETKARVVRLESGEALFEVAKDSRRPFVVQAGDIRVRAVGTAFVVRRRSDVDVDVTVTKGAVDVWSKSRPLEAAVRIKAGTATSLSGAALTPPRDLTVKQIEQATDWKSGIVDLNGRTLGEAAAEINRYNTRRVVIPDAHLASQTLVGHVSTADPLAFAQAAAAMLDARVRDEGEQLVLEPLPPPQK
jgi:transmembrane sensor